MINDRIEALITHFCKGNKSLFAQKIGVRPSVIGNITGERKGNPSFELVQKILDAFVSVSPDWFVLDKGPMLRADERPIASVTPSTDAPAASAKPDESILYNMYKDLQTEKEKIRLEKESEIKELNAKMLAMSEEIGRLKAKLGEDEPEAETHPKGLGQKTAEDVSIKKRSSQSYPDAPSVGVPSGGR